MPKSHLSAQGGVATLRWARLGSRGRGRFRFTALGKSSMPSALESLALDQLFRNARSTHAFRPEEVTDTTLQALYDLLKWGPTAFNAQPGRYVFVRSQQAKARLAPAL